MFGLEDFWIGLVYSLCILSTILCVIYGAVLWNKNGDAVPTQEEVEWVEEEDKIDEEM